jgi:hypothetical protein
MSRSRQTVKATGGRRSRADCWYLGTSQTASWADITAGTTICLPDPCGPTGRLRLDLVLRPLSLAQRCPVCAVSGRPRALHIAHTRSSRFSYAAGAYPGRKRMSPVSHLCRGHIVFCRPVLCAGRPSTTNPSASCDVAPFSAAQLERLPSISSPCQCELVMKLGKARHLRANMEPLQRIARVKRLSGSTRQASPR